MKIVNALALTALSLVGSANAFTLDFTSFAAGTQLNNSITVNVPGYGNVTFTEVVGSNLEIAPAFLTFPGINIEDGESVVVSFGGAPVQNIEFVFAGLASGETFSSIDTSASSTVSLTGGNGANLFAVSFETQAVPEPSSTLLLALSALGLVGRRRR